MNAVFCSKIIVIPHSSSISMVETGFPFGFTKKHLCIARHLAGTIAFILNASKHSFGIYVERGLALGNS